MVHGLDQPPSHVTHLALAPSSNSLSTALHCLGARCTTLPAPPHGAQATAPPSASAGRGVSSRAAGRPSTADSCLRLSVPNLWGVRNLTWGQEKAGLCRHTKRVQVST